MKSYAKVNILLKITGFNNNFHQLASRFVRVSNLYDTITFCDSKNKKFEIIGDFDCKVSENIIYKTYLALKQYTKNRIIDDFFLNHKIVVEKNIPICSGLGGGSSNGAIFLLMLNRELNLNLSLQELVGISTDVGSDLAFFLHNINSANVYGRGDIIENFKEDEIELDIYTPKIKCITKDVYNRYKITNNKFKNIIDIKTVLKNNSKELINKLSINQANDLYEPAVNLYPKLKTLTKKNYYFSGSGSSFFKIL